MVSDRDAGDGSRHGRVTDDVVAWEAEDAFTDVHVAEVGVFGYDEVADLEVAA